MMFCAPSCFLPICEGVSFPPVRVSRFLTAQQSSGLWRCQQNAATSNIHKILADSLLNNQFTVVAAATSANGRFNTSLSTMRVPQVWKEGEDYADPERLHDHGPAHSESSCSKHTSDSNLVNILEIIKGTGNWRYQKAKELKALRLLVDPILVLKVITHDNVNPGLAWKFFVWAKKQMGYKHTSETYNAMLGILCDSRKFTSIFFVLEDMHEEGCALTSETCMKMAKTFGSAGLVERALHALNHMARLGSPATSQHYNSLVNALLKNHHYYKAYVAYSEMVRAGCEADSYTFKVLIRDLDKAEKVDLASQLYNEMVVRGCEPDPETSSVLIGVLCKAGRIDDAVFLFERLKQAGIRPNTNRYNTLIHYLGKENKVEKALELFDELRCHGCLPDHETLSFLVDSLRSVGRDEDADRCYKYTSSPEDVPNQGEA